MNPCVKFVIHTRISPSSLAHPTPPLSRPPLPSPSCPLFFPGSQVPILHPPIFIIGHYRSGTSLLHELLNNDERLVAPTAFQCYVPRIFLGREVRDDGRGGYWILAEDDRSQGSLAMRRRILVSCDLRGGGRLALCLLLALGRGPLFCGSPYQCFPSAPLIPPSANPSFHLSRGS